MKLGLNFIPWLVECCGSDTTLVLPQRPWYWVTQMMLTSRLPTISLLLYFTPVPSWLLWTSTKRMSLRESSEQTTYSKREEYCQARWRDTTVQESTDQIYLPYSRLGSPCKNNDPSGCIKYGKHLNKINKISPKEKIFIEAFVLLGC